MGMKYSGQSGQRILILKEGSTRRTGKDVQTSNIAAARVVADVVKATLGPRGMDKMLVDTIGDVTITNDGHEILKEIDVQHPAAKMIVEVAETRDMVKKAASTSMRGKLISIAQDHFSDLAIDAVKQIVEKQGDRLIADKDD